MAEHERERLIALTGLAQAESSLFQIIWEKMKEWATKLRVAIFGHRRTPSDGLGQPLTADAVWSTSTWWDEQVDDLTPVIEEIWTDSYANLPEAPPWQPDGTWSSQQAARRARNRLVNVPESVFADVRRATLAAVTDGWSMQELAADVERILGEGDVASWRGRAMTIARTEALSAYNGGRYASYLAYAGSVGGTWEKIWLATHDHRTRFTHTRRGGGDLQRVSLLEPFVIGGAPMLYPGDPEGPPDETINCRCSILLVEPGEHVDLSDRQYRSAK